MKTIEINLYSYDELSNEAKQCALREWNKNNTELLYDFKDYCKEVLKEEGFIDTKVSYSLSYCQGDGLCFSARKYNKLENLFNEVLGPNKEKTAKLLTENCVQVFKGNNGHYSYAAKSDVDLYLENNTSSINVTNTNNIDSIISEVLSKLEDIYIDICKQLENTGYSQIKWEQSEEAFIDSCQANDYTFEINGKMNNG